MNEEQVNKLIDEKLDEFRIRMEGIMSAKLKNLVASKEGKDFLIQKISSYVDDNRDANDELPEGLVEVFTEILRARKPRAEENRKG